MNIEFASQSPFAELESSVRSYCRSFPSRFKRAIGSHLVDVNDRKYIDFLMAAGSLNYGHNCSKMVDSLIYYLKDRGPVNSLDLYTSAKAEFLEDFKTKILTSRGLEYRVMFCGPTGTNSVEAALKIAKLVTGRDRFACFTNGFHGMTHLSLQGTASKFHRRAGFGSSSHSDRYPYDGYLGDDMCTVDLIEKFLDDPSSGYESPAAFLVECVQGEGGLNVAGEGWLNKLSALAKRHGSLLIVDDIQAGCGRTGSFFSFEKSGIKPDLVCLSKSLSGLGLPMAVVLVKPDFDVFEPGQHSGTFRGNNLAFVTARVALSNWQDQEFLNQLDQNCQRLRAELTSLCHDLGSGYEVVGRGMMCGIRCADGEIAAAISSSAFAAGLIIETCGPQGEVLKCLPALNIPEEVMSDGVQILRASVLEHI